MDYSTISNKTTLTESEELSDDELSKRYYLLKSQYEHLLSTYETTKQDLHDTKRSYQLAVDVQTHLTAELENNQEGERKLRNELNSRITSLQEDIGTLREERSELVEKHVNEIKRFEDEVKRLKEEQAFRTESRSPERDSTELDEARMAIAEVKSELDATKATLEEAHAEIASWRYKVEEMVTELAEMRVTADIRREELKAANEREAVALADLAEAKAVLHQCTDSQELQPHAAKGNSIFAEVEDKRQEMAKTLLQMKQTNSRLRRELANKQAEVEALLHEKQTVWEQQAGASAHYDNQLIESHLERITQLENLCERQRREIAQWFSKYIEPTANGWLSGVLHHLRTECDRLRGEALSHGTAQLTAAGQARELRRKLAAVTAHAAHAAHASPLDTTRGDRDSAIAQPLPVVREKQPTAVDDVKKKVSFN